MYPLLHRGKWAILTGLLLLLLVVTPHPAASQDPFNAPEISTGSIQAGCYLASPGVCKIHVEPFTIITALSARLETMTIWLNSQVVYALGTDSSNAPTGSITLSQVKLDFAAHCNQSYTVTVRAKDASSSTSVVVGTTRTFACPEWDYIAYLPVVMRP